MTPDQLINLLAFITLLEMMVGTGLSVTPDEVLAVVRDRSLLLRATLANYVLVPLAAVGLLLLFGAQPLVGAGLLIIAVCPGAPYAPPFTAMARGRVALAVGLMALLAASSALLAPLLLKLLLPIVAAGVPVTLNAPKMMAVLMLGQFVPLCAGIFIASRLPDLAARLRKPFVTAGKILNLLLISVILAVQFETLLTIRLVGHLGMLTLLGATILAGWMLGSGADGGRRNMAITTAVRNGGVGLVIVTSSFPGTAAVTAATAYALVQTVTMALVALAWGRKFPAGVGEFPAPAAVACVVSPAIGTGKADARTGRRGGASGA